MRLTIEPVSAATLAAMQTWRHEPPYDFYDGDVDPVLNPERFFEALDAGVEFGRDRFRPARVVLAVAAFNERAVGVYERGGFAEVGRHVRHFDRWGDVEFVDMEEVAAADR